MCISDISASINTEVGDLSTVELSQSYFTTLAPYPWREESDIAIVSCSVFYVTESLQTKDKLNECVDFVYLFVGSGSVPGPAASNNNLTTRKIHTSDGFTFNCDDSQPVLQWLTGNPTINQYIPANQAVPGTKLVSWVNNLYQYVTVVSTSYQTVNQGISVNWLTTGTNSFQLKNGIVVKGFTGDVCNCGPSASILDIPCNSSMSFCVSQSTAGSGQFVLPLSGSESVYGSTKIWQVTGNDGVILIPQATSSYSALDGNLNLDINQTFSCCTCSIVLNLTEMHVSNSVSESSSTPFNGFDYDINQGQVSKLNFTRGDIVVPYTLNAPTNPVIAASYAINNLVNQPWMVITLSGSGGPQNGPEEFAPNLGYAETRLVVPTGSTVEASVDNIVKHLNASSSHPYFTPWLTDVSASRSGTRLIIHRTTMGSCGNSGVNWNAFYQNWKYTSVLGGISQTGPEAGNGNLSSGDGLLYGAGEGSAMSSSIGNLSFVSGSTIGTTSVTLSFTRSGCDPSNLPQNLNVCYEESVFLGSSLDGSPLAASDECCFQLQLNNAPFWNNSSSYCQGNVGPYIDLCDTFGACNYDTISFARNTAQYPGYFVGAVDGRKCSAFKADPATIAQGSMILNFTASAFNSKCINSASAQPSFSAPFTPSTINSPGQGCCPDISGSVQVYFNPTLVVQDSVQCYPTMSLNTSTLWNFPTLGPASWSIIGADGSPSPHAVPGFIGQIGPDEIYTEGANLLHFNTATSHSTNTEAYLTHHTTSGLYTASVSITNGPCIFTNTFHVKMVSASADAGPNITFCDTHVGDTTINMNANGTTGFWQYTGINTAPSIGAPNSPTTKIFQPACSTYEYSWTISSQSLHIINGDTHSLTCEDTDTMTVFTRNEIASHSLTGIINTAGVQTNTIYTPSAISKAPYETNMIGCPPYEFSFLGTVDAAVNHVTWSVYMSESLYMGAGQQHGPIHDYPDKANDGVMGKFEGNNAGYGFMIGGLITNSESNSDNPGRSVSQRTIPPLFPAPNLVSRVFHFSSSFTQSYGKRHYMSLTAGDTDCGCPDPNNQSLTHSKTTFGSVVFRPSIESFDIHLPNTPGGSSDQAGHITDNEVDFDLATNFTVVDPTLGITIPKYHRVVLISFHSGSSNIAPTTASAVCAKGNQGHENPSAPYLTMSFCSSINWPIQPVKKMGMSGSNVITHLPVRSTISIPHGESPYWPGPSATPARSFGLASGSQEPLSFEWTSREIATYRANGATIVVPSVITGSFTDTMTSISYEEAPTFFPGLRAIANVSGISNASVAAPVHSGYTQIGGAYGAVASQSVEFQCTMSRRSLQDNSVIATHYASKSVMFTY